MSRKFTRHAWTVEDAATEWNINPRTLRQRLTAAAMDPDESGKFTTSQIDRAKNGNLEAARIRESTEKAEGYAIHNAKEKGRLVPVDDFQERYATVYLEMVRVIRSFDIPESKQDELLKLLAELQK